MRKKLAIWGLVVLIVSASTYAFARGPWHGSWTAEPPCWQQGGPGKAAPLTPEQRARFQELREKFLGETAGLRESILAKRQELRSLWRDSKTSEETLRQKERELRELLEQMRDKAVEYRLEARKLLTPEQLSQFGGWRIGSGFGPRYREGRGFGNRPLK